MSFSTGFGDVGVEGGAVESPCSETITNSSHIDPRYAFVLSDLYA